MGIIIKPILLDVTFCLLDYEKKSMVSIICRGKEYLDIFTLSSSASESLGTSLQVSNFQDILSLKMCVLIGHITPLSIYY